MKNVKIIFTTLLFAFIYLQNGYGQVEIKNEEKQNAFSRFANNEKVAFKLNYFGELGLHPGLEIGTDYTLAKRKWITVHWDTGMGGYWHRWNNTSVFLGTSIGSRVAIRSMFIDLNIGAGYMHSFPAGTIYRKAANGGIEKAPNLGTSHFRPSFSTLIGWDGTRKNNLPFTFHIGAEAYLQSNFNHIFLPHIAAKIGMTYKFLKK